jgi:hypothetical protein
MFRVSRFSWLLGGLMVLLAIFAVSVETVGIYEDEGVYESTAQSLVSGKGYAIQTLPGAPPNAKYPFLYPAWLALLKWIVPGSGLAKDAVLKLSNVPILMLFLWMFYRLLRVRFQWPLEACQFTVTLTAVCGIILPFALVMMTEIPFMLFAWLLIVELMRVGDKEREPRWWVIFLAGLALYYLRTAGVAILAATVVFLWIRRLRRPAMGLAIAWLAAAIPWMLWSRQAAGEFAVREPVISDLLSYYVSYSYHTDALLQTARDDGWMSAAGFAATIALKNLGTLTQSLGQIFFPITLIYAGSFATPPAQLDLFTGCAGAVAAILAVQGYRSCTVPNKQVLGLVLIFHIALFIVWPWPFAGRFLTPVAPAIILFVAESVRRWSDHWSRLRAMLITMSLLLQVWTLGTLAPGGTIMSRFPSPSEPPYKAALEWLRPQLTSRDLVFSGFTSQWVGRELGTPVVRYNTLLPPKTGLKLQFKIDSGNPAYADEFAIRLREWDKVSWLEGGRKVIFAEVSLDNSSWKTLQTQVRQKQLKVAWDPEQQPVKIFEATP